MATRLLQSLVRYRGRLLGTTVLLFLTTAGLVLAQQGRTTRFESLTLSFIPADQAAQRLRSAFPGLVEVIADPAENRLLVSADPQTMQIVRPFVRRIDVPAVSESIAPDAGPSRLQVGYRVSAAELDPIAQYLRSIYLPESGLIVATDPRSSELWVIASSRIQSEIEAIMRGRGYAPVSVGSQWQPEQQNRLRQPALQEDESAPTRYGGSQDPVSQIHELKHISMQEFEAAVVRTWGNRLSVASHQSGELVTVELPAPQGVTAVMHIDRANNRLIFEGHESIIQAWHRAMGTIDVEQGGADRTRWIPVEGADLNEIQQAVSYLRLASSGVDLPGAMNPLVGGNRLPNFPFRLNDGRDPRIQDQDPETQLPPDQEPGISGQDDETQQPQGLIGPVDIFFIEELGIVIVRGNPDDVARVNRLISEIVEIAQFTQPIVDVYMLENVDSQAIGPVVQSLYDQVYAPRVGTISITPLGKPNSLLIVGRAEAVELVKELIGQLDVPVDPESEFRVFYARYMSAIDLKARIDEHYLGISSTTQIGAPQVAVDQTGLATRVRTTADYRSNALIVSARPRDMQEIERLIDSLDVPDTDSENEVRIIHLRNALAEELQPVLQDILNGQLEEAGRGFNPTGDLLQDAQGFQQQQLARIRSVMLSYVLIDPETGERRRIEGGIGYDLRVTADTNSNALIVQGPPETLGLVEILVKELDRLPDAETQIKVFQIINGDASKLLELMNALFATDQGGAALNQLPLQSGSVGDDSTLVALRFAIDTRTNSLIVSGSESDLRVVEDLLLRLDMSDLEDRVVQVTRLHNAEAQAVADAVNLWLDQRAQLNANADLFSIYEQADRTIIVVAEPGSNSLIVSATQAYVDHILTVIEDLDRQPPMVLIQVLLAQVALGTTTEFGIEAGIQDSLVFDRGASNIRFLFNQSQIGNDNTAGSLGTREDLAGIGLSNLNVGRTNDTLGFGGLVLSAGNESINLLLRALHQRNRLQVLSRPQIMTVENLQGYVQVGQRVPYITQTTLNDFGQTNTTTFTDVGVLLQVTPRVTPDGLIVMAVDATKSSLGPEEEGIPISINQNGDVIRSPQINIITAQTTVMARTGQTVVMGGLIETTSSEVMRGVPILSDIPAIGSLFRFDQEIDERSELLLILTPFLIENDDDLTMLNQMEMDRMSWCLADVAAIHGAIGFGGEMGMIMSPEPATIYPDSDPTGSSPRMEGPEGQLPMQLDGEGAYYPDPQSVLDPAAYYESQRQPLSERGRGFPGTAYPPTGTQRFPAESNPYTTPPGQPGYSGLAPAESLPRFRQTAAWEPVDAERTSPDGTTRTPSLGIPRLGSLRPGTPR